MLSLDPKIRKNQILLATIQAGCCSVLKFADTIQQTCIFILLSSDRCWPVSRQMALLSDVGFPVCGKKGAVVWWCVTSWAGKWNVERQRGFWWEGAAKMFGSNHPHSLSTLQRKEIRDNHFYLPWTTGLMKDGNWMVALQCKIIKRGGRRAGTRVCPQPIWIFFFLLSFLGFIFCICSNRKILILRNKRSPHFLNGKVLVFLNPSLYLKVNEEV